MSTFRVWAPAADAVDAHVGGVAHRMHRDRAHGWWSVEVPMVPTGTPYGFALDGGEPRPDPRGVWLPDGVHGLTRRYDQDAFDWHDQRWRGVPLAGSVVYELHVGTFTQEGTFAGATRRLDHLVELGVDVVELLPVHAFPGRHGWGYDVAAPFSVHEPYGGPDGLKAFVDACHARGLAVALDVVYNHFGPDGAYVTGFGPYLTDTHTTPWGPAVNFDAADSDEVRRYVVDNALTWLRDFHVDGLRLDAVHAIADSSATHLLEELGDEVDVFAAQTGRSVFVIAESDLGDPRVVWSRERGGYGLTAQWNDDFHHALHVTLTGEQDGYYADFRGLPDLATALRQGYVYTGQYSTVRRRRHGRMPSGVPRSRLLAYLQDHDQIGNRAQGERSSALVSTPLLQVAAALVLTSGFTPMLFMGEEWGASTPWQYFTDHDEALGELVKRGRRAEFASFGWRPEDVPDPQDPKTFERSVLHWAERDEEPHRTLLAWHRDLIALRRRHPALRGSHLDRPEVHYDEAQRWLVVRRDGSAVVANLSGERRTVPIGANPVLVLLASTQGWVFRPGVVELPAESVAIIGIR